MVKVQSVEEKSLNQKKTKKTKARSIYKKIVLTSRTKSQQQCWQLTSVVW